MEVAAAGHHHLLLNGPAGSGKSLMAKCLPGIMPAPSFEEAMEIAKVYSVAGVSREPGQPLGARPFRSPHHSISDAGLVGGGTVPKPGEITLSHNGVLFLDELPEFRRSVLEVLRQLLKKVSSPWPGPTPSHLPMPVYAGRRHESLSLAAISPIRTGSAPAPGKN